MAQQRFLFSVILVLSFITAAYGIKCYVCTSTYDTCVQSKNLLQCPSAAGFDRCLRISVKRGYSTTVATSCANQATCDTAKMTCDDVKDGQCQVDCCDTDACNTATSKPSFTTVPPFYGDRKCYVCTGFGDTCSKDNLEKNKATMLVDCGAGVDKCMRVWAKKNDQTAVATSCTNQAACDAVKKACDGTKDGQCTVNCCDSDACNAELDGLKCYTCAGTEDECAKEKLQNNKNKYLVNCGGVSDKCMRITTKQSDTTQVVSSCATQESCDTARKACDTDGLTGKCAAYCCDTDECNAATPVSFNLFLMTVCSVFGLIFMKLAEDPTEMMD